MDKGQRQGIVRFTGDSIDCWGDLDMYFIGDKSPLEITVNGQPGK